MSDVLILGTDTDAGKTTLALLWLILFGDTYEYWKPVESGPADSAKVAELVPNVLVHPSIRQFHHAVAPPLAARLENRTVPSAANIARSRPSMRHHRHLLVETFGSPFSPLNENELQVSLIQALGLPSLLVGSSAVGAVGRTLQCLMALAAHDVHPSAVVLLGDADPFAVEMLRQHRADLAVFSLKPPTSWTSDALRQAATEQEEFLDALRICMASGGKKTDEEFVALLPPHTTPCNEWRQRDADSVWHPYSLMNTNDPPLVCSGGRDEFLLLDDGRRVIDGISSWWTILHGHRFAPLMTALRQALEQFDHVHFAGVTHAPAVELAELLLKTMPWSGGRVFYSDDGSTAVEVALKMAYQFWCHHGQPERKRFIGFQNGYHGDTFGAMAVSRDPLFFGRFEPFLFGADILPLDPNRLDEHLARHAGQTAGVILEPLVQGAGGMRMHSPETLRQIFEVTRARDVLFLADEVMTGGGRTGTLWAHQAAGIAPDLVCAGKTLAGGILPLAATLASPRIVEAFAGDERARTFFHGHSFTAHPPACAVAVTNWKLLGEMTRLPALDMELFWETALEPLRNKSGVREVRIRGSIAAVEVDCEGGYLAEVGQRMRRVCLDHGVLLRPLGNVLYAMPPLRTSRESLEKIAAAIDMATNDIPV